jgi:hypothetical protein
MSKWCIGWKVLMKNKKNDDYYSINASAYHGAVKYGIGLESSPHKGYGPLAVFDSMVRAKEFRTNCVGAYGAIAKCKYIPDTMAQSLWTPCCRMPLCDTPKGTCLAKKVILTEEPVELIEEPVKVY